MFTAPSEIIDDYPSIFDWLGLKGLKKVDILVKTTLENSHDTTQRPHVHFITVSFLRNHFGSGIVRCSAQCPVTKKMHHILSSAKVNNVIQAQANAISSHKTRYCWQIWKLPNKDGLKK